MKKRLISLVLTVALLFSLSSTAFALSTYTIPSDTVVLDEVPMDYEVLVIPDSVIVISDTSLRSSQYPLAFISLGNGVQHIGANSFSGASIQTVTIPDSVTFIGENAFPSVAKVILKRAAAESIFSQNNPTSLLGAFPNATTIVVEANYTDFSSEFFFLKTDEFLQHNLENAIIFNDKTLASDNYLAEGSIEIPDGAYEYSSFESILLPDSIRSIGCRAFCNSALSYIDLAKVITIEDSAFHGCGNLKNVTIPSSVEYIGNRAFTYVQTVTFKSTELFHKDFNQSNYQGMDFSSAFPEIKTVSFDTPFDEYAFSKIISSSTVQTVKFSDGYTWQKGVFSIPNGTTGISKIQDICPPSVTLPDSVEIIYNSAFSDQPELSYIDLGKTACIEDLAFYNCTNLIEVTIPSTVEYIGQNAFNTVRAVTFESTSLLCSNSNPDNYYTPINFSEVFPQANTVHINAPYSQQVLDVLTSVSYVHTIAFPDGYTWQRDVFSLPAGITEITSIYGYPSSVTLPDSVRIIGQSAFASQPELTYINLGKTSHIGDNAFSDCTKLTTVTIPATVEYIGEGAFNTVQTVTFETGSTFRKLFEQEPSNFNGAFPNVSTVYINTTANDVSVSDIICNGSVKTIIYSDGYIWQKGVFSIPEGTTEIGIIEDICPSSVTLPDSVSTILPGAFMGQPELTYINLNKTTRIGNNAFDNCPNLTTVTIPATVEYIGQGAFNTVQTVTFETGSTFRKLFEQEPSNFNGAFPNVSTVYINTTANDVSVSDIICNGSVKTIIYSDGYIWQKGVFSIPEGTTEIGIIEDICPSSVTLPDSVCTILPDAFVNQPELTYINLGKTSHIGDNAFSDCTKLTTVTIPATVTHIGNNAFNTIQTVTFESTALFWEGYDGHGAPSFDFAGKFPSAKTVYINTPYNEDSLYPILSSSQTVETIIFSDGNTWQKGSLFFPTGKSYVGAYEYQSHSLESIVIPNHISTIYEYAFNGVQSPYGTSLVLGENVSTIYPSAFADSSVNSIIFGSSPISIGEDAFKNTQLTSVRIPENVVSLGNNAFNTDTLTSVVIDASVLFGALNGKTIADVFGTVDNIIIEGNISEIPASLFMGTQAKNIVYSDDIVSIGANAFRNCGITTADIGKNVATIGENAFSCSSITSLNLPDSVQHAGAEAFATCNSLVTARLGMGLTEIADSLFSSCSALKTVVLSGDVTKIGTTAFYGCSSLTNINIPATVTEIGANAFEGCVSLKSVVIPDGVTTIKTGTFKNCTSLESITIPDSVTTIEDGAFEGCTALDGVVIPENLEEIQSAAFKNCTALDTVVVPENVTTVADDAFTGCENITLAGCSGTAVETYATANNVQFYTVNALPCQDTTFDFENNIVFTENTVCDDIEEIVKSSTDTEITFSDDYCGTGSTITITKGDDIQTYTLIVDGDLNGDSACDVLDAAMATNFTSERQEPSLAQIYAAGGKDAEQITVNEYASLVNKVVS